MNPAAQRVFELADTGTIWKHAIVLDSLPGGGFDVSIAVAPGTQSQATRRKGTLSPADARKLADWLHTAGTVSEL